MEGLDPSGEKSTAEEIRNVRVSLGQRGICYRSLAYRQASFAAGVTASVIIVSQMKGLDPAGTIYGKAPSKSA
jgi:hypothetical protein